MGNATRESLDHLNWYPGHMKKTRELIQENLKLVDAVIEVIDARIPLSSRNPIIDDLLKDKQRVIVMNKIDLADEAKTREWLEYFRSIGHMAEAVDANSGASVNRLVKVLDRVQKGRDEEKTRKRPVRLMIVGVPNVGKSSLINRLTGKKSAQTGDRPGVTKGKQWLTLTNGMQLLDTPGILWPKFEDKHVGLNLAFCGSIKDEIMDIESLCLELIKELLAEDKNILLTRYKMDKISDDGLEAMEEIAAKRGFIFKGGRTDYERTAKTVLGEFRGGKMGRITLERAPEKPAESRSGTADEEENGDGERA
ncbi:MAG: ribosome biogenesis GTPase YlqF [Clostridia bacterium]|nr:ribosome biogenesis GTPase YlqF [Clostridia bacterium]